MFLRRRVARALTALLATVLGAGVLGAGLSVSPAQADYISLCTGYAGCRAAGYSSAGYETANGTMYWRMYSGHNCTNYAAYRMVKAGMPNTRPWTGGGNAEYWGTSMKSITNATPTVGAIAWWGENVRPAGSSGHVAYVEKVVSATEIWISEDAWGGDFHWRKVTKTGTGWPSGFVHFRDAALTRSAAPSVTGTPRVGATLTAKPGTWTPTPTSYTYQWLVNGTPVTGGTASTLRLTPGRIGKRISVTVTAVRSGYASDSATSAATAAVTPGVLATTAEPVISGKAAVGTELTVSAATWSPAATSSTVQWLSDGTPIPGATDLSFTPAPEQVGTVITAVATAQRTGYQPSTLTSAPTGAVVPGVLVTTAKPVITGKAEIGSALTLAPGAWSPTPTSSTVQWRSDGTAIPGATGLSLTLGAEQVGTVITAVVTGRRTGYQPSTLTSAPTAKVIGERTRITSPFAISGVPTLGRQLQVVPGTYQPADAELSYTWLRNGVAIARATGPTYVLRPEDVGAHVGVEVGLSKPGFVPAAQSTALDQAVRTVPQVTVTPTGGPGRATVSVLATAPGVDTVYGPVSVTVGKAVRNVWLHDGAATVVLRGIMPGQRHVVVQYPGRGLVLPGVGRSSVVIQPLG